MLLLDSSDQYRSTNFQSEKVFLKDFIDNIDLEHRNVRMSLYTYGSSAFSQFTFDMYRTAGEMKQAVDFMWFATGDGKPESAIQFTVVDAFKDSNGDRECVPNILVVLTHLELSDAELIRNISQELDTRGIQCIFINMAGTSAQSNIQTLTKTSSAVLPVVDFASLETSAMNVFQMVLARTFFKNAIIYRSIMFYILTCSELL